MIYTEPGGRMEAELARYVTEETHAEAADRRVHGGPLHGRDARHELRARRHDRGGQGGHRRREDRAPRLRRDRRWPRRSPRSPASSRSGWGWPRERQRATASSSRVEVDDSVRGDAELAQEARGGLPGGHLRGRRGRRADRARRTSTSACSAGCAWTPRRPARCRVIKLYDGGAAPGAGGLTNPEVTPELFRERIADSFPGDLGIEVVRIEDDEVEGRLEVDRRHLHPGGYVHGGVWVAFADTVAAWGTFRHLQPGQRLHDGRAEGERLRGRAARATCCTAIGRPLHMGRRTQVWEVRIQKDGQERGLLHLHPDGPVAIAPSRSADGRRACAAADAAADRAPAQPRSASMT